MPGKGNYVTKARERIQAGMLIKRLQDHAKGEIEMSATQVRAAEILIKRVLPELRAIEFKGSIDVNDARQLTRDQLLDIAAGGSQRVIEAGSGDPDADPVH